MEASRVFHYRYISVGCVLPAHCRESGINFTSVRRHFATCNHNTAGSSQNVLCQETEKEWLRTTRFPLGPWFSRCCSRDLKESKSNLCPSDTLFLSSFGLGLFLLLCIVREGWKDRKLRSPRPGKEPPLWSLTEASSMRIKDSCRINLCYEGYQHRRSIV